MAAEMGFYTDDVDVAAEALRTLTQVGGSDRSAHASARAASSISTALAAWFAPSEHP